MTTPRDFQKPTDMSKPLKPAELGEKAKAHVEKITQAMEQKGERVQGSGTGVDKLNALADSPLSPDDWMEMDTKLFSPKTQNALEKNNLTADNVLSNPTQAEIFTGQVLEMEGVPDGNGGTEKVRGAALGHYDQTGHGIDVVAANEDGVPVPVEVKKYNQPSGAHLSEHEVVKLEPEVERWRQQREAQVLAKEQGNLASLRTDANADWKPEVQAWHQQIDRDARHMKVAETGKEYLSVQQMDDLWVKDRWLKVIQTPEGRYRMRQIGVEGRFLDYPHLRSSPELPEWKEILGQRTTVIVSGGDGHAGKHLTDQSVFEGRSRKVVKIKMDAS